MKGVIKQKKTNNIYFLFVIFSNYVESTAIRARATGMKGKVPTLK